MTSMEHGSPAFLTGRGYVLVRATGVQPSADPQVAILASEEHGSLLPLVRLGDILRRSMLDLLNKSCSADTERRYEKLVWSDEGHHTFRETSSARINHTLQMSSAIDADYHDREVVSLFR